MCGKNKIAIVQWPLNYTGALLLKALLSSTLCCYRALYFQVSAHVTVEVKPGALLLWALLFRMLNSTVQ